MSITAKDRHGTFTGKRREQGPPLDRRTARYFAVVDNVWSKGYRTRREAEEAERDAQVQRSQGVDLTGGRTTFREYVDAAWWPHVEAKLARGELKPSTVGSYRMALDAWVLPSLGDRRLRDLRPAHVRALYRDLARERGLSPKTLKNAHGVVSNVLSLALSDGCVVQNVAKARGVAPKAERSEMKVWDASQLRTFLDSVRDDRLYAAWRLLATTGMRRGELLGLRWSDLDLDADELRIERAVSRASGPTEGPDRRRYGDGVEWSTPKTKAGRRVVDLDAETVVALRAHRRRHVEERLASLGAWPEVGPHADVVFTDEAGRTLSPQTFSRYFDGHAKAAALPRIRLHDLRHTAATLMLRAGVPSHVVSQRLGHASVSITLDVYAHVLDDQRSDAADKFAALIDG